MPQTFGHRSRPPRPFVVGDGAVPGIAMEARFLPLPQHPDFLKEEDPCHTGP